MGFAFVDFGKLCNGYSGMWARELLSLTKSRADPQGLRPWTWKIPDDPLAGHLDPCVKAVSVTAKMSWPDGEHHRVPDMMAAQHPAQCHGVLETFRPEREEFGRPFDMGRQSSSLPDQPVRLRLVCRLAERTAPAIEWGRCDGQPRLAQCYHGLGGPEARTPSIREAQSDPSPLVRRETHRHRFQCLPRRHHTPP